MQEDGKYVADGAPVLIACGQGKSMYDVKGCLSSWILRGGGGGGPKDRVQEKLAAAGGGGQGEGSKAMRARVIPATFANQLFAAAALALFLHRHAARLTRPVAMGEALRSAWG